MNLQSSPLFSGIKEGEHEFFVRDKDQCMVKAPFKTKSLKIKEAFSSNRAGIDDVWDLSALSGCQNIKVTIFDRYERALAELNSSQLLWDGYYLNKPAPSDAYWYLIHFGDGKTPDERGPLTLKRK